MAIPFSRLFLGETTNIAPPDVQQIETLYMTVDVGDKLPLEHQALVPETVIKQCAFCCHWKRETRDSRWDGTKWYCSKSCWFPGRPLLGISEPEADIKTQKISPYYIPSYDTYEHANAHGYDTYEHAFARLSGYRQ